MPSLKLRMALPMPLPRPGRRLAPKMMTTIARIMSNSGSTMRPMVKLFVPRILPPPSRLFCLFFLMYFGLSAIAAPPSDLRLGSFGAADRAPGLGSHAAGGQFSAGVNLVEVYATVTSGDGRAVEGLP